MGYAGYIPTKTGAKQRRRLSTRDKKDLMRRLGKRCAVCGATEGVHLHHKVPVSQGGISNKRNLEVRCEKHRY
jgi:5-methylcytosine-specific restriction endonuclease McrA